MERIRRCVAHGREWRHGGGRNGTPCGDCSQNNVGIADGVIGMARKNGGDGNSGNKSYISVPNYDSSGLTDTFTASGFFRVTSGGG